MVAQSEGEGGLKYSNCAKCFDGFAAHVLWTVLIKSEFLVLKRKFGRLSSFSIGGQRNVCIWMFCFGFGLRDQGMLHVGIEPTSFCS